MPATLMNTSITIEVARRLIASLLGSRSFCVGSMACYSSLPLDSVLGGMLRLRFDSGSTRIYEVEDPGAAAFISTS
ncbi:MAG: hypothetical protein IIC91_06095 [Chloroflexi bacterium]|nr:hypothetical protein [Chloroflexota bacterium]MCH8008419.1 hypothetical protein [Chloroflexota bacterium]